MTQFDAEPSARPARQIDEVTERPKYGRVVQVFENAAPPDDDTYLSNFEVDVDILDSPEKFERAIPLLCPQSDEVKVPKVGDKVIVEYRGKSKKSAIARQAVHTNEDRPPRGRAGMWRKRVESGESPAGSGDLYVESYTGYDIDPATNEFDADKASPQLSFLRLSKKEQDTDNPIDGNTLPMMIELFDHPAGDDAYISLQGNAVDGDDSKSMEVDMNLKDGTIRVAATDSNQFGLELDVTNGTFKILDESGYGIESDGDGNFTWHYETVDYNKGSTTSL
jgi:hypothetical protein